jgi:uncharacterized protein (TIGR04255 family)
VEALIDIRVALPTDIDLDRLATFSEPLLARFSESKPRMSAQARIEISEKGAAMTSTDPKPDGHIFRSPSENLTVQARLDGFTLSKAKPYESWKTFCPQFVELWQRFVVVARPLKITRVALRYINRIPIPLGVDMKEYLLTIPEVAPGVPQFLASLLMRLAIPHQTGSLAVVTLASVPPGEVPGYPLIFDIDVFREVEMLVDDPSLWKLIRELRAFKNTIFFKSLTPRALEMFR